MSKTKFPVTEAFLQGKNKKDKHDSTDGTSLYYRGNKIAWKEIEEPQFACDSPVKHLYITNAGWPTVTTKCRLNSIPNVAIIQRNYQWFICTDELISSLVPWDGEKYKVY